MKFKSDFGVYVCPHVFEGTSPVLDSVCDYDGDWQFLCGDHSCVETSEPKYIGVGHLVSIDSSINELTKLEPGMYAERAGKESPWKFGKLDG